MNITFLIGNGFDIQLGLKSSYSDFLRSYTPNWNGSNSNNKNIADFKWYLQRRDNQELWADAEKAMGIHLKDFNDDTIGNYHERIEDFETQMIDYLESQQARCGYTEREKIAQIFLDFLLHSFNDVLNDRACEFGDNAERKDNYYFITFNYTNLLANVVSCCLEYLNTTNVSVSDIIYHVHGTLDSQIIMGVNDESQLDLGGGVTLTELIKDELIKPIMNNRLGGGAELEAEKIIINSDVIYTYGISYGETDRLWWDVIRKWLKENSEHKLVVFIKEPNKKISSKIPWHARIYEDRKRADVLKKLGIWLNDADYKRLLSQIYIILNTTRLNLKELVLSDEPVKEVAVQQTR